MNKIDYRLQAIPYQDAFKWEMIGEIVVLKCWIKGLEDTGRNLVIVHADPRSFGLHPSIPWHNKIYDDLDKYGFEKNKAGKTTDIYLRGEIFFDEYTCNRNYGKKEDFVHIRPIEHIRFIVGNDDFYF